MKITIVGGGNIGTLMAAEFAFKGHDVVIYTSSPERFDKTITVFNVDGTVLLKGDIAEVTSDINAVADSDYIFVTLPSIAQSSFAERLSCIATNGMRVGIVPGYGGAEFLFKDVIKAGASLFGFQRVHAIARLDEYGKKVVMRGRKDSIFLGSLDNSITDDLCKDMFDLFDMPCIALPNYLCVTLTPSNPILHTSRLFGMFKEYTKDEKYSNNIMFYEEWTDFDSGVLFEADSELQKICAAMDRADLSSVRSLKNHYESYTVSEMTRKIRSISAFRGITSPMTKEGDGWVPDFNSRYFTCDFSYGLDLLRQFGSVLDIPTPTMDKMMSWYRDVSGDNVKALDVISAGIDSIESIYEFYNIAK